MPTTLLVALLLALQQDHAREVLKRVTFPSAETVKSWSEQGPEYRRVLEAVLSRDHWAAAIRTCEEKLGAFGDGWTIDVKLGEWRGTQVASGDRVGDRGEVRLNMRRLGEYERRMDEVRREAADLIRKGAKPVYLKSSPLQYPRIIHHELVHVLQGETRSPGWFHEGLAAWLADDACYIEAFFATQKEIQSVDVDLSAVADDEVARGHAFFRWFEERRGKEAVKELYKRTVTNGDDWKEALQGATGLEWSKIVAVERERTAETLKKKKPKD